MTPEAMVKKKVDAIISKYSNVIVNAMTKGYGKSGVSDKLICINGRFIAIETKTIQATGVKKYPTKLQFRFLLNVVRSGGYTAVINETNTDALDKMLHEIAVKGECKDRYIAFDGCPTLTDGATVTEVSL